MNFNDVSPYIRVAMDSMVNPPWGIHERVIFDYELLYIKEGKALITIEEREYNGRYGDIFLFKPKQRHSIKVMGNEVLRQPHIHFDLFYREDSPDVKVSFKPIANMDENELELFREDVTLDPDMNLPNKINVRDTGFFENLLFDIIGEYQAKAPFYELNMKGLFLKLWTYLLRQNNYTSNPAVFSCIEELERVKQYLDANTNRMVTLDDLSKEFKISKYHLTRLFKKAFNVTPIYYNQIVRIEKAKQLVQYSSMSLTSISEMFGFNSINAFSRAFRTIEGVPPSFYRRRG